MLADAHPVDAGAQSGKAHIHGHPLRLCPGGHLPHHGDHPRVVPRKDGFHMGRTDVPVGIPLGRVQIEGKVIQNGFPGGVVQRPAVLQGAGAVIGGHGHHLTAGIEPGIEVGVPAVLRHLEFRHHVVQGLFQRVHIIAHGPHHLADRLGAAGTGVLHHRGAITAQKGSHTDQQRCSRHRRDQRHNERRRARGAISPFHEAVPPAVWVDRWRRSAPGEVPLYFLKQ